jgi:signal transduction histidine kinase
MNIPLKYLLPLLTFITGLVLVIFQTYINMNSEHAKLIKRSSAQAKVIGNRLASSITLGVKHEGFSKQKIMSLTAPYMADSIDQVDVYNERLELQFSSYIPLHKSDKKDPLQSSIAYKVTQDQFSDITFLEKEKHVIAYFPINLPVQKGQVLSRNTGVIHLVFDVEEEYLQTRESIIYTAIINIIIITLMVSLFSSLMYFLVFRRLNALHKASLMLSLGNFNVKVKSKGDDELTQVIHTFNSMAVDMSLYKHDMEKQVKKALEEQMEQSKLLVQQSRLASMGEMIGNIAHQWRQPLNAIGLIIQKVELFSKRGKLTEEVLEESIHKATSIITNMSRTIDDFRDFFKPDKQMEYFDLKTSLNDVMSLLEAGLKEAEINVKIDIPQASCEIYGFKNEFSQVIINLVNNSKDALIEAQVHNKTIYISEKIENAQVVFRLSDNAGGIPEDIINRIFEPYYTTKEEGKGTGIGLYMSKMIIEKNMHGLMQVKNSKDGAEFSMTFKNIGENS